jgi:hypothetical protein
VTIDLHAHRQPALGKFLAVTFAVRSSTNRQI